MIAGLLCSQTKLTFALAPSPFVRKTHTLPQTRAFTKMKMTVGVGKSLKSTMIRLDELPETVELEKILPEPLPSLFSKVVSLG
jgi:hypothetical protein